MTVAAALQVPEPALYSMVQIPDDPLVVVADKLPVIEIPDVGRPPDTSPPSVAESHVCTATPAEAVAVRAAKLIAEPPSSEPFRLRHAALRALVLRSRYFGSATAARMPRITITATSSIIV